MRLNQLVATAVVLVTISVATPAPQAGASTNAVCSTVQQRAGLCTTDVTSDGLDVGAMLVNGGGTPANDGLGAEAGATVVNPNGRPMQTIDPTCRLDQLDLCDDATAATESITIADLASFTPAVGELVVQPENWGVLGIPTNFVATATDHVQQGTLLGQPIEVRWRPVAFTFDYGDGTAVTTEDPGALWVGTDDDWTATATTHEYQSRGEYAATVTITFEADIAADGGWSSVPGTLDVAAPTESVRIFEVHTVLTRGDCIDYPDDPGCSP